MTINTFLHQSSPMLDVRSPAEFAQGHIPGAHSFSLFTDAERAQVGTLYKQQGREAAVKLGLHLVGPKLVSFAEAAEKLADSSKTFRLYCWRGSMRSSSVAFLLQTLGYKCLVLEGGYKTFRRGVQECLKQPYSLLLLGGFTGSGKTEILHGLHRKGEQVIDLEELANHRGSCFGHLGCAPQPSTEQFENLLAWKLMHQDQQQPIWLEDESRLIGSCCIPEVLWKSMLKAPCIWLHVPKEERLKRVCTSYGSCSREALVEATQRLVKKLGSERTKRIIQNIDGGMEKAAAELLEHYDRAYTHTLKKQRRATVIEVNGTSGDDRLLHQLCNIRVNAMSSH